MDRKFKPPFFSGGDIAPNCRACQAHKSWVKIAVLLRLVPAAQLLGSARLARRRAARSNSERAAAMDCVGNRFRLSVLVGRSDHAHIHLNVLFSANTPEGLSF